MSADPIRPLEPGEQVADVAALSVLLDDVPVGTLHYWASVDRWPRRHTRTAAGRRTEYSIDAAQASMAKRRPGDVDVVTSGQVTSGEAGDLRPYGYGSAVRI
jgi:hypothetical protein